ncbi:MAG: VanZ family protein [Eubacteriales bacterium]|nr:VanZ family protein [Eubacteriales bacterium]
MKITKLNKGQGIKILFGIYLILLIWIIIFRMDFSIADIHRVRELNLIPFYYKDVYAGDIPVFEAVLNLFIFVPFGVYLKMLNVAGRKIFLSGFATSLMFEVCQYIFKLGASDITDIITNTLGAVCGVYLYLLFCKIMKDERKANKIIMIIATAVSVIMAAFFLLMLISSFM